MPYRAPNGLVVVQFDRPWESYAEGDRAGFTDAAAAKLVRPTPGKGARAHYWHPPGAAEDAAEDREAVKAATAPAEHDPPAAPGSGRSRRFHRGAP
jgi:hypothetical protein